MAGINRIQGFSFQNFTILKHQTLGHGSYGAVYKARCDQMICAAKVLHPTIVDPYDPGSGRILQRFRQECRFLNGIRHPHIVQYLGLCRDPESNLPVLLMELLDSNLTKMLEQSQNPLSYHVQIDLCHDIALAVAYLHSNDIIHRDLSGNNVLVIAGRRAKVTDFGMSKLVSSDRNLTPLTLCPGTLGYMSPEALKEPPRYTEKLDIFSQGVIMIQVCTQQFPDPGPAVKDVDDPRSPTGTIQMPVLEPERRKTHIDLIDPRHPLLAIATMCLEYKEADRPLSEELCQRLALLKENQDYTESVTSDLEALGTLQRERNSLAREVEDNTNVIIAQQQQIAEKDQEIERLKIEKQILNERLLESDQLNMDVRETNEKLQRENRDLQMQVEEQMRKLNLISRVSSSTESGLHRIEMRWRNGGQAPFCDWREQSVVNGNMAYFSSHGKICSFDSTTEKWSILPQCPQKWGSLAIIRGLLTMVGGRLASDNKTTTNRLVSLSAGTKEERKWEEHFPPIPTCRNFATATTYHNHLIIAGGSSTGLRTENVSIVEVLNTSTMTWSTAASLPHPFGNASATVCGDKLYILGGNDRKFQIPSVFTCSLPELLQTCQNHSPFFRKLRQSRAHVWHTITDTPVYLSTCATIRGQLLAIGGSDANNEKTTVVFKYNPNTHAWDVISNMTTARSACYVAVMATSNQLLVAGGLVHGVLGKTSSVEIAQF